MGPRIVFFGTPTTAARALDALVSGGFDVTAAVSQPDRPAGRGNPLRPTPVREVAERLDLELLQPTSAKEEWLVERLAALSPDLFVVVAYGCFLPDRLLNIPKLAALNLHFSLLPLYRGAAPVNWALVDGAAKTGVTVQRMVKKMDAGDIVLQREVEVGPEETAEELYERLTAVGLPLLLEAVERVYAGTDQRIPQDESLATFAPLLKREHGGLDFTRPATELYNRWRGLLPWPGVHCRLSGGLLKVNRCRVHPQNTDEPPGTVFSFSEGGWLAACGGGSVLELLEVQAEGRRSLSAHEFARGRRLTTPFLLDSVTPAPRS